MAFITGEQIKGFVIGTAKQAILNIIGSSYPDIDDAYKVSIFSAPGMGPAAPILLSALLQNEVHLTVGSEWGQALPAELASVLKSPEVGLFSTAIFGRSAQTSAMSRRVWVGTSPMSIKLDLILLADEADSDVIKKVQAIQSLALPSDDGAGSFLKPPGPSPFKINANSQGGLANASSDDITIRVGKFLVFQNVIIQSVDVVFENRMSSLTRKPTCAKISIVFETYELLTKAALKNVYDEASALTNSALYNKLGAAFNVVTGAAEGVADAVTQSVSTGNWLGSSRGNLGTLR